MKRKPKDYLLLVLKGIGMGAADVIPGVSGGTIAFITGIYEELINSVKSVNLESLKLLFRFKLKDFFNAVNGKFLVAVVAGIGISIVSLARILKVLLENHPIPVWSFFFGLIAASAIIVGRKIKTRNIASSLAVVAGVIIAYFITSASPATTTDAYWFVFLSGAIAICAMILPGISGAFILLLLGKYQYIITAVSEFKAAVLVTFAAGAALGIISFSNVLSWLLRKYHDITIAVLTGFMLGSLNKIWPWKQAVETFIDRHGKVVPIVEKNILPDTYTQLTEQPSMLTTAVLMAIAGFAIILFFEFLNAKFTSKQ